MMWYTWLKCTACMQAMQLLVSMFFARRSKPLDTLGFCNNTGYPLSQHSHLYHLRSRVYCTSTLRYKQQVYSGLKPSESSLCMHQDPSFDISWKKFMCQISVIINIIVLFIFGNQLELIESIHTLKMCLYKLWASYTARRACKLGSTQWPEYLLHAQVKNKPVRLLV